MAVSPLYESRALRAVTGPTIRPGGLAVTEAAVRFSRLPPGSRVLDLGCGTGATVGYLTDRWELKAVGIDRSARLLADGRRDRPDLPLARADAGLIPVASGRLDAVSCECVLSLTADPMAVLRECVRVLRPGGYLILADLYRRSTDWEDLQGFGNLGGLSGNLGGLSTGGSRTAPTAECCIAGAVSRECLEGRLTAAGFSIRLWTDYSEALKVLAARLVWESVDPSEILATPGRGRRTGGTAPGRLGYCLVIATRDDPPRQGEAGGPA